MLLIKLNAKVNDGKITLKEENNQEIDVNWEESEYKVWCFHKLKTLKKNGLNPKIFTFKQSIFSLLKPEYFVSYILRFKHVPYVNSPTGYDF